MKRSGTRRTPWTAAFVLAALAPVGAAAGPAWPQWGGPDRNFKVRAPGLADHWPESGPPRLWTRELGEGYSTIVSDGKALYTMYRVADQDETPHQEIVVALDAKSGRTLWEYRYDAGLEPDMNVEYGPGPHSTPLIVGDALYTVGVTVKVHALRRKTGGLLWSRDLRADYGATHVRRGYCSSPLAWGRTLILPIGGEGQAVVALDRKTGELVWRSLDFGYAYASPLLIEVDGQEQVVVFHNAGVDGLAPEDGRPLWHHDHPTQMGVNISTPVWGEDGILFLSSAYGTGARAIRLERRDGTTVPVELWTTRKLQVHFGNAVRVGHHVYGTTGHRGPAFLFAVDARTGEIAWRERGAAKASWVHTGDKWIILDEDGNLTLARATSRHFERLASFQVSQTNAWTAPTLVGGTLYVRDRERITAFDLAAGE